MSPRTMTSEPDPVEETDRAVSEIGAATSTLWQEYRRHLSVGTTDAQEVHRSRHLSLWWDRERPVLWLEGMLGSEQGAALESALGRRAEQVPQDPEAADPMGARLADALVEAVTEDGSKPAHPGRACPGGGLSR